MTPNESPGRPRAQRKSKPNFEIPAEVASLPPADWAYRTAPAPARRASAEPEAAAPSRTTSGMLTGGMEMFALSFTTMGRMSLAAATLLSAPLGVALRLMPPAALGRHNAKRH